MVHLMGIKQKIVIFMMSYSQVFTLRICKITKVLRNMKEKTKKTYSKCNHWLYLHHIHISEPTRLRRISYAVSCLKKKNQQTIPFRWLTRRQLMRCWWLSPNVCFWRRLLAIAAQVPGSKRMVSSCWGRLFCPSQIRDTNPIRPLMQRRHCLPTFRSQVHA